MKKIYLLSLMLMGSISLFTSCVDGDYYDLYDEEEILSPRNKKSKDVGGEDPYPLMNDGCAEYNGWFKDECAACAYANITNCNRYTARLKMIRARYGELNPESYKSYFEGVKDCESGKKPSINNLCSVLGLSPKSLDEIATQLENGSLNLSRLLMITQYGEHVSRVTGTSCYNNRSGGFSYTFHVVDQLGSHYDYAALYLRKDGSVDVSNSTPGLYCFLGQ